MNRSIEDRMAVLERQNRRLKLVGGSAIGMVLLVALFGQATSKKAEPPAWKGRVIEAEQFIIRDKNGRVRVRMSTLGDIANLVMSDKSGRVRAGLSVSSGHAFLALYDSNGIGRVSLSSNDLLGPSLGLNDEKLENSAGLSVNVMGPSLQLDGKNGEYGASLSASVMGANLGLHAKNELHVLLSALKSGSLLTLSDSNGKNRMTLDARKIGPFLRLNDAKGEARAILGKSSQTTTRTGTVTNRPESSLVLYNKEGKTLWQAPQD